MTQEALKLALEALDTIVDAIYINSQQEAEAVLKANDAITVIKEALREHAMREVQRLGQEIEQEPVIDKSAATRIATSLGWSPQRTWVGLTNNELQPIADEYRILFGSWVEDFARAIEAKLRERNT